MVFYVPGEIQTKIAALNSQPSATNGSMAGTEISVSDVLFWAIHETYADLSRSIPLWAVQGTRFARQQETWDAVYADGRMSEENARAFLEAEAMSLEERYKPHALDDAMDVGSAHAGAEGTQSALSQIAARCRRFDAHRLFASAAMHEEQERELAPEVERERQIQRPPALDPARHVLHPDVRRFAQTGERSGTSWGAFVGAFASLKGTSAAAHFDVAQFPGDLLVTADFAETVVLPRGAANADAYQRSVQWVLTRHVASGGHAAIDTMVIISPYEAQELIPAIKEAPASAGVHLHLYAPRPSLAFAPLDHLQLYTVPPLPKTESEGVSLTAQASLTMLHMELNLFAGQLFFGGHGEYRRVCELLGLAWQAAHDDGMVIDADGFVCSRHEGGDRPGHMRFHKSPVRFLSMLLTEIRGNGAGIARTHWGKIFAGQFLGELDFK